MSSPSANLFDDISPGSIDFSPYQPNPIVTIILEDIELAETHEGRMERFWRVWYKERSTYAPALKTLVLGLRPQTVSSAGIERFLDYFNHDILHRYPKVGLDIYMLPDATDGVYKRRMIADDIHLLYSFRENHKYPLSTLQSP